MSGFASEKTIAMIIPYFGKWPDWIDLYFETLRRNAQIDFHFFTDCTYENALPENVFLHFTSFQEYVAHANQFLDFEFRPPNAYKLCDLRPMFGTIHNDILKGYDFYGWTDVDILFGDIRSFYTEELLSSHDLFSTHDHRISGHLAIFRNNKKNRNMFRRIYKWKEALQNPEFVGIDEHGITNAYLYTVWDKVAFKYGIRIPKCINEIFRRIKSKRMFLVEQYTTPFVPKPWIDGSTNNNQPSTWYYKDGTITNHRDGTRKFIYLHFMNFKSATWRHDNTDAPWAKLNDIVRAKPQDMKRGIKIDLTGIEKI